MTRELDDLEAAVGHPGDKWDALQARVQSDHVRGFGEVEADWLDLMWSLDAYRTAGVAPRGMGDLATEPGKRLQAIYRGKGNWFASLLALLLENQTSHRLAPRTQVQGFSQPHQIDVAWPDRNIDPLICLETKVTGAPPTSSDPARGAMADWTNRRKELKFAATDLKLFRRQQFTAIEHWGVWRKSVYPKTYFMWAARLRPEDSLEKVLKEARILTNTYLEGAGIVAWHEVDDGYEPLPIPPSDQVQSVEDLLYQIASEIGSIAKPGQNPPKPEVPDRRAIDES